MIISACVHAAESGVVPSVLWPSGIPSYMCAALLYPTLCRWAFGLLPCPGCRKQCCCEREGGVCLFELQFGQGVRPGVGPVDHIAALCLVF